MKAASDGRNIDLNIGTLSGEASHQLRHDLVPDLLPDATVWPEHTSSEDTYYDRPVIKKSVWSWDIPAYYYVGGATGCAMVLGAAATLLDADEFRGMIRQSRVIGVTGATISGALLIHDLGMPSRFLHMLRVFRPTSPMSMGTWILMTFSTASGVAFLAEFGPEQIRFLGTTAATVAGLFGLGLSGYTGVLVANTTVPLWQRPHRLLPLLFLSSAVGSAASLFDVLGGNEKEQRAATIFGTAGKLADMAVSKLMEQDLATVPQAVRPLREGFSGMLWQSAFLLTGASLVLTLVAGKKRGVRRVAGILGTLGAVCTRFGVHYAGQASAMNPRATFDQQRAGQGAYATTGKAAVTGPGNLRAH
jgi:formate-dependent nitrite reductase membrane component NrfD